MAEKVALLVWQNNKVFFTNKTNFLINSRVQRRPVFTGLILKHFVKACQGPASAVLLKLWIALPSDYMEKLVHFIWKRNLVSTRLQKVDQQIINIVIIFLVMFGGKGTGANPK